MNQKQPRSFANQWKQKVEHCGSVHRNCSKLAENFPQVIVQQFGLRIKQKVGRYLIKPPAYNFSEVFVAIFTANMGFIRVGAYQLFIGKRNSK
jgi:hypothetical protein